MVQQQSKNESISEGIKSLRHEGAGLEWVDKEGRTPLILACTKAKLYDQVKTLVESGSNVNAYCSGRNGGTPLHYAAKRGLEKTVKLLLSYGANPLVRNDDLETPLKVARDNGYSNVVRAIESHICFFSGWMRQSSIPSFLDLLAPQLRSRKVWVVIVPTCSGNPTKPSDLELVVYESPQDAQPRTVMALSKAKLEEPKSCDSDASVMIVDNSTRPKRRSNRLIRSSVSDARRWAQVDRQVRLKLEPATIGDMEQLNWFCDACKGISQPMNSPMLLQTTTSAHESAMKEMAVLNHHASMANLFISHEQTPLAAVDEGGCVICFNASHEAACVPCGHVAGCVSCLKEIKDKNMGCPVCRSNIDQVIKLYHV